MYFSYLKLKKICQKNSISSISKDKAMLLEREFILKSAFQERSHSENTSSYKNLSKYPKQPLTSIPFSF